MVLQGDERLLEDPAALSEQDLKELRQALYDHSILVIRNQQGMDPNLMPKLAAVWDDKMINVHSGGKAAITSPDNILSRTTALRIPTAPNAAIIGNGSFENYHGIDELKLRHVSHQEFHAEPLSKQDIEKGQTRFYRWHLDAPLYENLPGKATILHGVIIPRAPQQTIKLGEDSELPVAAGATAFVSGARAFQLLSKEEQEFALNTEIQYAPRPYEWMRDCKATADGLSIAKVGNERAFEDLPPWTWDKVQSHPMAWKNPGRPSQPHLQVLGCCALSLRTRNPQTGEVTTIDDLQEVRNILHGFQKRVMRPEYVYAHDWKEGDLVIFHNHGVWHSITGELGDNKRLMWQCTMASGKPPERAVVE